MNIKYAMKTTYLTVTLFSMSTVFGCANYEVNTKRGNIPGYYIRQEMQEADRAVEAARRAGKDTICPEEFKATEAAKNNAFDVFRACHTEEGAALAKKVTAQANALCPAQPAAAILPLPVQKAEAPVVIIRAAEPKVEEKVKIAAVAAVESKVVVLVFEDVHFGFDKSTLTPEAKTILKRDILLLKENPKAKVRVAGYTSASGTVEYNQKLSERRALAVQEYLVSEGIITRDRLSTIGYGESNPAAYEAAPKDIYSDEAKANMRVLFEIIVE
jgi:outer membrane protein OmpA-like peptidoglycan-associated protein